MIIFTDIGGGAQERVENGNLSMVMWNDRWIELHQREIDGGVSCLVEVGEWRFLSVTGEHERRCGGQFEKIKEPENYKTKETKKRTSDEISTASSSQSNWSA